MSQKTFVNELGNEIKLSVSEKEVDNVSGVLVSIAGPSSDTEVHITKEEAKVLLRELQEVLES